MYNKAIAALLTPFIVTLLIPLGLTGDSSITEFITAVIFALSTAVAVYFVPNKV